MNDVKIENIETNETDLMFQAGDFVISDNLNQRVALIIKYGTGHLRQYPDLGVHIDTFNNGQWGQQIKNVIRRELAKDNIKTKTISNVNGEIKITL